MMDGIPEQILSLRRLDVRLFGGLSKEELETWTDSAEVSCGGKGEVELEAGDYVSGLLDQHGRADLTILAPDGSPVRHYPGPTEDGKRLCVFIADTPGTYRMEVTTSAALPVNYTLTLNQVLSLDERLKPKPWQDPKPSPRIEALRKQAASGNADPKRQSPKRFS
jgi:hypothetical protein